MKSILRLACLFCAASLIGGAGVAFGRRERATPSLPQPIMKSSRREVRAPRVSGAFQPPQSATPLNERVLVVYNANSPASVDVADYYVARRGIPQSHKCAISPPSTDWITWGAFDLAVKNPIKDCLNRVGRGQILYIVFTYQTPFNLHDVPVGEAFRTRSVDQYVADIWDEYSPGNDVLFAEHPYYAAAQTQGNVYQPFVSFADYRSGPGAKIIYSVWRLDAASDTLAKGLVDKAVAAEAGGLSGQGCFDRNRGEIRGDTPDSGYVAGDWDLRRAAEMVRLANVAVTEDGNEAEFGTPPAPSRCDGAALYAGWYSYNNYNDAFSWNPGAIGFHLDSASALNPRGGSNWSANALINGITLTSGAVAEPYLEGLAHADGLFRNLLEGATAGDAFLRNTAFLKWMILNFGDPLYRPFAGGRAPFNSPNRLGASLSLAPRFVFDGQSSSATVALSRPAPAGGTVVTLANNSPSLVSAPPDVTIPAGETSATFTITANFTTADRTVVITASDGAETISNTLFVGRRLDGHVDEARCDIISGWALNRARPDAPLDVEIYDGPDLLAIVRADIFRQDLLEFGVGGGRHGFALATPANLRDGRARSISLRFAGSDLELPASPKTLTCAAPDPPPAPTAGVYRIAARHSGKCIDVGGASLDDQAAVIQWDCHGGANQRWRLDPIGDGYYRITAGHSGKLLDVAGESVSDAAPITQHGAHGGVSQQWRLDPVGDGYYRVTARHSGKALDVDRASPENGAALIQYASHAGGNQQWLLQPIQ